MDEKYFILYNDKRPKVLVNSYVTWFNFPCNFEQAEITKNILAKINPDWDIIITRIVGE